MARLSNGVWTAIDAHMPHKKPDKPRVDERQVLSDVKTAMPLLGRAASPRRLTAHLSQIANRLRRRLSDQGAVSVAISERYTKQPKYEQGQENCKRGAEKDGKDHSSKRFRFASHLFDVSIVGEPASAVYHLMRLAPCVAPLLQRRWPLHSGESFASRSCALGSGPIVWAFEIASRRRAGGPKDGDIDYSGCGCAASASAYRTSFRAGGGRDWPSTPLAGCGTGWNRR